MGAAQLRVLERCELDRLLERIQGDGYTLIGPVLRDGAIVYDRIDGAAALPFGWTDEQDGGRYRLRRRDDEAVFGYSVSPQSWKRFLQQPRLRLFSARRRQSGFDVVAEEPDAAKMAFIGVRSCELHAIAIQDRVLLEGEYVDPHYEARRRAAFVVAVNCSQAGGTCFCVSMRTGPKAESGYDLALTELLDDAHHAFLVEVGSDAGARVLADVPTRPARTSDRDAAVAVVERTAARMGRTLDTDGIGELLQSNLEHPRWDEVASRCLACANCTMVCPTCFCTTIEDTADLAGEHAERWRRWDSCFTTEFSHLPAGSVRSSVKARYRQWMVHKLSTWIDQFGSSGCVGCGRCITWCPVGIDLTEEAAAIRASTAAMDGSSETVRREKVRVGISDDAGGDTEGQGKPS